jgi:hypothetical protein
MLWRCCQPSRRQIEHRLRLRLPHRFGCGFGITQIHAQQLMAASSRRSELLRQPHGRCSRSGPEAVVGAAGQQGWNAC